MVPNLWLSTLLLGKPLEVERCTVGWCIGHCTEGKSGVSSSLATWFADETAVCGKESEADWFGKHALETKSLVLNKKMFFSHGARKPTLFFIVSILLLIFVWSIPRNPSTSGWIVVNPNVWCSAKKVTLPGVNHHKVFTMKYLDLQLLQRWLQIFVVFYPHPWGNDPIWLMYIFQMVGSTTNQKNHVTWGVLSDHAKLPLAYTFHWPGLNRSFWPGDACGVLGSLLLLELPAANVSFSSGPVSYCKWIEMVLFRQYSCRCPLQNQTNNHLKGFVGWFKALFLSALHWWLQVSLPL